MIDERNQNAELRMMNDDDYDTDNDQILLFTNY